MVTDYAEQILQAVDIVVKRCVDQIAFDRTEICTIVNDSDKKNGRYTVTNGAIQFDAFVNTSNGAEIPEYKVDDSVRVSIANGDYSQKKYIEGLNVTDNDSCPITYVSPLETLLDMTGNILPQKDTIYGLRANDRSKPEICLWSTNLKNSAYRDLQNNSIYDTIALRGDFKTLLTQYDVNSGEYGLRLDMYFHPTNDNKNYIVQSAELNCEKMFGNPYSFLVYSTQAIKFSIANMGIIDTISLYFYQKNDFTHLTTGAMEVLPVTDYDNLLVKNIYLSFGSDIANIEDNTLKIYTSESLHYNAGNLEVHDNDKGVGLLWYNKDEDGRYLGFSDGYFDPDYDEEAYLEKSQADTRLVAQQGKDVPTDKAGLSLSADIEEAEPILKDLRNMISKDLYQHLVSFRNQFGSLLLEDAPLNSAFNNIVSTQDGLLVRTSKDLETDTETLIDYYTDVLSRAKARQESGNIPSSAGLNPITPADMMQGPKNLVDRLINENTGLVATLALAIQERYAGFTSIFDNFERRTTILCSRISKIIEQFETLMQGNDSELNAYFNNVYYFEPYIKEDYSEDDNKYCIYWYRYIPPSAQDSILDDSGELKTTDRFMDKEWQRMPQFTNVGIPKTSITGKDGMEYNAQKTLGDEGSITFTLSPQFPTEKYVAILFYNHQMIKSNEIEFINGNPPIDGWAVDLRGALYIDHDTDSRDTYQAYGVNNCLINAADAYHTRYVKVQYDGEKGGNEQLIDAQVFWYIPKNSSMLTYSLTDFGEEFKNDSLDTVSNPNSMEGYTCFYRSIPASADSELLVDDNALRFPYHIKDYYAPTFSQNNIICRVIPKDSADVLEASISFTFSSYGTSGTDYTLVVAPASVKSFVDNNPNDIGDTHLCLNIALYDFNNEQLDIPFDTASISWYGPTAYNALAIVDEETGLLTGCAISPKTTSFGYGVLQVKVVFDLNGNVEGEKKKRRTVDLTTFYPVSWSAGNYYIEGASTVVYDSSGGNPTYYKNPFKLFNNTPGEDKDTEIANASWNIQYYDETGKIISGIDEDYALLLNYMPLIGKDNELVPCSMFLACDTKEDADGKRAYPLVTCSYGSTVWAQPILLMQNRYASAMLNAWDGSLQIDEENGTILSSMVGAGRKTKNNTFEGVLMGDVGGQVGADNQTGIGLYGYHDGAQSFKFGIDGKAFIGKASRGRIHFDGNKGTIASASYYQTRPLDEEGKVIAGKMADAGMMIDLDDGFIDIRGAAIEKVDERTGQKYKSDGYQSHITLNAIADAEKKIPYFRISTPNKDKNEKWKDKDLIYIGLDRYFLQTENYEASKDDKRFNINDGQLNTPGTGMMIDLLNSLVDAYNLKITSKNFYLDSTDTRTDDKTPYFIIKSNKGNNLVYVSNDEFYLKTDDYVADKSGTKIDLKAGRILSHNFEISAGNETDGLLVVNNSPKDKGYYFYVGNKTNNINFTKDAKLNITAQHFKLSAGTDGTADYVYLSNTGTTITHNETKYSDILLKLGTKFGVSKDGTLYADSAKIIGTITATAGHIGKWIITEDGNIVSENKKVTLKGASGEIVGSAIYVPDETAPVFKVTSAGEMTATKGLIGNWTISKTELSSSDGTVFLNPSGRTTTTTEDGEQDLPEEAGIVFNAGSNFSVDVTGKMTCGAGAIGPWEINETGLRQMDNGSIKHYLGDGISISIKELYSLPIQAVFKAGDNFAVDTSGSLYAHGARINDLTVHGSLYIYNTNPGVSGEDGVGTGDTYVRIFSKDIWIGLTQSTSKIWIDGTTTIGSINPGSKKVKDSGARLYINGSAYVEDDITFEGIIYAKADSESVARPGVNGTFKVETGGWSSSKLIFSKGILVDVLDKGEDGYDEADEEVITKLTVQWTDVNGRPDMSTYVKKSDLSSYATTGWVSKYYAPVGHSHSEYNYDADIQALWSAINALTPSTPEQPEEDPQA